jgi:hypothetical protein
MPTRCYGWPAVKWQASANLITTSPSFYSDLFEFSYEAVGALDPRHEIVTDWTEQNRLAAIYLPQRDAGSGRALMEHLEGGKCSPGADCRGLVR